MQIRFADSRPDGDYALVLPVAGKDRAALDALGQRRRSVEAALDRQRFDGEARPAASIVRRRRRRAPPAGRRDRQTAPKPAEAAEKLGGTAVARLLTSGETHAVIDLTGLGYDADAAAAVALARRAARLALRPLPHAAQGQAEADARRSHDRRRRRRRRSSAGPSAGSRWSKASRSPASWSPSRPTSSIPKASSNACRQPGRARHRDRRARRRGDGEARHGRAARRRPGLGPRARACWSCAGTAAQRATPPIAFVGKGVTFDTGGISIKPAQGMEAMKWDMGGAGAVVGAMKALALRKAKANIVGICGLVENMPDGNAQRPGDVVTTHVGPDDRGDQHRRRRPPRARRRDHLRPAELQAGDDRRSRDADRRDPGQPRPRIRRPVHARRRAGRPSCSRPAQRVGDKLWRMPLAEAFDRLIDSPIADMKNVGPREGGSITAAQFIQRFVDEGVRWAHLDIAGMAWSDKAGHDLRQGRDRLRRAAARPVRRRHSDARPDRQRPDAGRFLPARRRRRSSR